MMEKFFLFLLFVCFVAAAPKKQQVLRCNSREKIIRECGMGAERDPKLKKVNNTQARWAEVTPKSFVGRWDALPGTQCYYIEILRTYTINVYCIIPCVKATYIEIENLRPSTVYGIEVSAVQYDGKCSKPGLPARTRTLWAPTTPEMTKPGPTYTPEPKQCGKRFFTCHANTSECIPSKKWCDKQFNCRDGSDERGCPNGCEELNIDFKNGNYSCSRFGSPDSSCFFDCDENYERDGFWYTKCDAKRQKWRNPVPTCRLSSTESIRIIDDEATDTSVTVEWESVKGAVRYTFLAIEKREKSEKKKKKEAFMRIMSVDASECCQTAIQNLQPDTEFEITMRAIDKGDIDGMKSKAVFGRTLKTTYVEEAVVYEEEPMEEEAGSV